MQQYKTAREITFQSFYNKYFRSEPLLHFRPISIQKGCNRVSWRPKFIRTCLSRSPNPSSNALETNDVLLINAELCLFKKTLSMTSLSNIFLLKQILINLKPTCTPKRYKLHILWSMIICIEMVVRIIIHPKINGLITKFRLWFIMLHIIWTIFIKTFNLSWTPI